MAEHYITITHKDETGDKRLSQTNTATDVAKTATKTTTEPATTTGSTPKPAGGSGRDVAKVVGGQMFKSTPVGQVTGQITGMVGQMATPVGISLVALGLAKQAFDGWRKYEQEKNEWNNTYAIQYGVREGGNMRNQRTGMITGKIRGDRSGGGRR